ASEAYGLTSQMRRSAVSMPSNIAEGFMRGAKEYAQFLRIALGSAAELETQISLAADLGYCNADAPHKSCPLFRVLEGSSNRAVSTVLRSGMRGSLVKTRAIGPPQI
ncbi:MAG: four helix bundle protein, partial [Burkholderiales bacterium]